MANQKLSRGDWIDAGLAMAGEAGVDAIRVEPLARRLGVTKGSFYGYFATLESFLAELLAVWEREVTEGVRAQVGAEGDPRGRVREMARALVAHPHRTITTELAIRDWGRRDAQAAAAVARVQAAQQRLLVDLFEEFVDPDEAAYRSVVAMSVRLATPFLEPKDDDAAARIALVVDRLTR